MHFKFNANNGFFNVLFQFFLSNRAVYLLVWNTRLGYEHSGLDFWLSSIACHCPKAPIFIVGTHADQVINVVFFKFVLLFENVFQLRNLFFRMDMH